MFFGTEGIAQTWRSAKEGGLNVFTQALCSESERFHVGENSRDDRLAVAVRWVGPT